MSNLKESIEKSLSSLPELLSANDLVDLGLYPSKWACYKALQRDTAPPRVSLLRNKLRFPKVALIAWLVKKSEISTQINHTK